MIGRMRIVTWNMGLYNQRFRAPGLHDQAWHYLLGIGPDLAFLQECLPPSWIHGQGQVMSMAFNEWGSVLFSPRYPLLPYRLPEESRLRALGSYIAIAETVLPDGSEPLVASVHARAAYATDAQLGGIDPRTIAVKAARSPQVNDLVFAELNKVVGSRFIVAGDWNTYRSWQVETS